VSRGAALSLCFALLLAARLSAAADFRSILVESGIADEEFAAFADWNGKFDDAQADFVSRLLFRLQSSASGIAPSERLDSAPGQLVQAAGRADSVTAVSLPTAAQELLGVESLWACRVKLADGASLLVLTEQVPAAWGRKSEGAALDEPVRLRGVVLGTAAAGEESLPLVLAPRLQWFPVANVSAGVAWLVRHGFDAALLDEVKQRRPFGKAGESLEAEAFYEILAILAKTEPKELVRLVRERLPAIGESATAAAADAAARVKAIGTELQSAAPESSRELQTELAKWRRRRALEVQVAERAARGLSSVWPMFETPEQVSGDAFLIEGTARRAMRIVVDHSAVASQTPGLREYYELDVFTTDSQNQPVICCVARLPEGFPQGELIREPVRVAGIFFKRWAYARRADEPTARNAKMPERLAPPVLLAAEPQWLPTQAATRPANRGLWAGAAFAGAVAAMWFILARVARRDRLARARQARYDAPLENLAEP
jgi:hypothetical protein